MEDASNTDIANLEKFFGASMELDFNTLKGKYASAAAPSAPWASSYWPTHQDSINHVWADGEASPSEKYATAFGLDVTYFKNKVSANNGIYAHKSRATCTTNSDCAATNDGSVCASRDGASTGYCMVGDLSPAAILEQEPQCDVMKNGVTFRVFDIKALLTDLYDGADLTTVFTGARFDGPDSPADTDSYGRYNNAARRDLGPGYFHIAIANIMGKRQQSFVVDVTAGAEVWNQPVRSYEVQELVDVTTASNQYFGTPTYPFNDQMVYLAYVRTTLSWISEAYEDGPLVSTGELDQFTTSDDYEYLLELDANYAVIGGKLVGKSKQDHPDFLWFPTSKPDPSSVIAGTNLSYANVEELLELSVACNSPTDAPTATSTAVPSILVPSSSGSAHGSSNSESSGSGVGIFIPITAAPTGDNGTPVPAQSNSAGIYIPITNAFADGSVDPPGKSSSSSNTPPSTSTQIPKYPSTPQTPTGKPTPPPVTLETLTSPPSSTSETPVTPPSDDKPTPCPSTPRLETPYPASVVTPAPSVPSTDYPVPSTTPETPSGKPTPDLTSPVVTPAPTESTVHFVC